MLLGSGPLALVTTRRRRSHRRRRLGQPASSVEAVPLVGADQADRRPPRVPGLRRESAPGYWASSICQIVPPTPTASTSRSVAKLGRDGQRHDPAAVVAVSPGLERPCRRRARRTGRRWCRRRPCGRPPSLTAPPGGAASAVTDATPAPRPAQRQTGRCWPPWRSQEPATGVSDARADRHDDRHCRSGRTAASATSTAGSGSASPGSSSQTAQLRPPSVERQSRVVDWPSARVSTPRATSVRSCQNAGEAASAPTWSDQPGLAGADPPDRPPGLAAVLGEHDAGRLAAVHLHAADADEAGAPAPPGGSGVMTRSGGAVSAARASQLWPPSALR